MADLQRLRSQLLVQRRSLLAGGGLLVASVLLLAFGAMPFWNRVQVVRSDIGRERQALQRVRQRANLLTSITPEDQSKFDQVGRALPLGKQPLVVLQTLELIAQEAGVSLGKYDLNPGLISTQAAEAATRQATRARQAQAARAQVMPVSIEVVGEFAKIQQTILLIEQSLPLMEVLEMSLNPETRETGFGSPTTNYIANLLVQSYFAPLDPKDLARQGAAALNRDQEAALAIILGMRYRLPSTPESAAPPPAFTNLDPFGVGSTAPAPTPTSVPSPAAEITPEPESTPQPAP